MADRVFLQICNPFDVSLERPLQTREKRRKVLTFPFILKEIPPKLTEMLLHSPCSVFGRAHLQQIGREVASSRNKNKCSINSNHPNQNMGLGSLQLPDFNPCRNGIALLISLKIGTLSLNFSWELNSQVLKPLFTDCVCPVNIVKWKKY